MHAAGAAALACCTPAAARSSAVRHNAGSIATDAGLRDMFINLRGSEDVNSASLQVTTVRRRTSE